MSDHPFELATGRVMGMSSHGDPLSRRIVVFCHPMPGAGNFDPKPTVTDRLNVHVLAFDRPGYGGSDPLGENESSRVQDRADDIAEYLSRPQMQAFRRDGATIGVVGWGFGGAVALSLAGRHPSLIARTIVVGLRKRTLRNAKEGYQTPLVDEQPKPRSFGWESLGIASDDPALAFPGLAQRLDHMLTEAATQGTTGLKADSAAAQDSSWTEDLGQTTAATIFVYGAANPLTNPASGEWLKRLVPHSRVARVAGARGFAIVSVWRRILEHVAP